MLIFFALFLYPCFLSYSSILVDPTIFFLHADKRLHTFLLYHILTIIFYSLNTFFCLVCIHLHICISAQYIFFIKIFTLNKFCWPLVSQLIHLFIYKIYYFISSSTTPLISVFRSCINKYQSASTRSDFIVTYARNATMNKLGGMESVKAALKSYIELPLKYPKKFLDFGVSVPKGKLFKIHLFVRWSYL